MEAKRVVAQAECESKPYTAVEELSGAAHDIKPVPPNPRVRRAPLIRVVTELQQMGSDAQSGLLTFTVCLARPQRCMKVL